MPPLDSALGGSPTETPPRISDDRVRAMAVEIAHDEDLNSVEVMELCFAYLAARHELRAARKQIEVQHSALNTPDVIGYGDEIGYAEENFDAIGDYLTPNGPSKLVWGNRCLGDWHAVKIVTVWDEDGDIDETEVQIFREHDEVLAAIAESNARRAVASSSQETPNG